ncbi:testis-specific Y-encoded-like protein 1, partial [Striga asiatica]
MESDRRAKRSRTAAAEAGDAGVIGPDDVALAIEKVKEAQDELQKINREECREILEIEKKYDQAREPVYVKRAEIISGIPNFWSASFFNYPGISNLLNAEDRLIFAYLDSLHVENFKDDRTGYCITFDFKPNPYFENTKLTKTMEFFDDGTLKSTGTTVNWKPGWDPSAFSDIRPCPQHSFFDWFGFRPEYTLEADGDPVAEVIKEDIWANPMEHLKH